MFFPSSKTSIKSKNKKGGQVKSLKTGHRAFGRRKHHEHAERAARTRPDKNDKSIENQQEYPAITSQKKSGEESLPDAHDTRKRDGGNVEETLSDDDQQEHIRIKTNEWEAKR